MRRMTGDNAKTFGQLAAIPTQDFYRMPLHIQKEAILLMKENGLGKTEILQRTGLFEGEYNRLFDGPLPLFKLPSFFNESCY